MPGKPRIGQCAYCGEIKEITREHVIPRCIFVPPLASNMRTIPTCAECNGRKSQDDDYLRDMLTFDQATYRNIRARWLFDGPVTRAMRGNHSQLARVIASQAVVRPISSPMGVHLGHMAIAPLDEERVQRIFMMINRGLFYSYTRRIQPADFVYRTFRVAPEGLPLIAETFGQLGYNGPYLIGHTEFRHVFMLDEEDHQGSIWLMRFYDSVDFLVFAFNPDTDIARDVASREYF